MAGVSHLWGAWLGFLNLIPLRFLENFGRVSPLHRTCIMRWYVGVWVLVGQDLYSIGYIGDPPRVYPQVSYIGGVACMARCVAVHGFEEGGKPPSVFKFVGMDICRWASTRWFYAAMMRRHESWTSYTPGLSQSNLHITSRPLAHLAHHDSHWAWRRFLSDSLSYGHSGGRKGII